MQNWISERYGEEDNFDFYAVNIAEDRDLVAAYVEQIGLEIPVILGTNGLRNQYLLSGGISPYPLDFVIDGQGIIQYANHEYEPEIMLMVIDRLLDIQGIRAESEMFTSCNLHQNYPNPFNSATCFEFEVIGYTNVKLQIYDLAGRTIATLLEEKVSPGFHRIAWNPENAPAGVYIVRMQAPGMNNFRKVTLLR